MFYIIDPPRISSGGIYEIVSRSVIHPRVPIFAGEVKYSISAHIPDKTRADILPIGYFVYPSRESCSSCVVSYCFQVDLGIYQNASKTKFEISQDFQLIIASMLEQSFILRSTGMINALRAKILTAVTKKKEGTNPPVNEKEGQQLFHIAETPLKDIRDSDSRHDNFYTDGVNQNRELRSENKTKKRKAGFI